MLESFRVVLSTGFPKSFPNLKKKNNRLGRRFNPPFTVRVMGKSGGRSGVATDHAQKNGFSKVHTMIGGMLSWNVAGFEVNP